MSEADDFTIHPVGVVRSSLRDTGDAPRQGHRGAPDATIDIHAEYGDALLGIEAGVELTLLTWLHASRRDILQVQPGRDPTRPLTGVFRTRAPVRPNPIGLHRVKVLAVTGNQLRVTPLEAVDGTPVIDIKIALDPPPIG